MDTTRKAEIVTFYQSLKSPNHAKTVIGELLDEIERLERIVEAQKGTQDA